MSVTAKKQPEAEMCAKLIEHARGHGWVAYPECSGFDVLFARNDVQVGIQAKMQFNATLLRQIIPSHWGHLVEGPQYRGILIPKCSNDVQQVCNFIGIGVFTPDSLQYSDFSKDDFSRDLPQWSDVPLQLPEYVPDVVAGASGPVQLTPWKISALKICAWLEIRGTVDRHDFQRFGLDDRRWIPAGWLALKDGDYVAGPNLRFREQHPEVYAQILEDQRKWFAEYGGPDFEKYKAEYRARSRRAKK